MNRNVHRHPRSTGRVPWLSPLFGLLALVLGSAIILSQATPAYAFARTWKLSAASYSGPEGSFIEITFQRTSGSNEDANIELTFTTGGGDGNAVAGVDYVSPSGGDITIPVGQALSGSYQLQTNVSASPDDKTLTVTISDVSDTGADDLIGSPSTATITIEDVDGPAPEVAGLSPHTGPTAGGTVVTITGANFTGATCANVKFGALSAPSGCTISANQITATSPAVVTEQAVHVTVTTALGGTSDETDDDVFTYTDGVRVTSLSPKSGPKEGGTTVVITGTGFSNNELSNVVEFGGIQAVVNDASPTQLEVTTPAFVTAQTVDVRVTVGAETSPDTPDDDFTYTNANAPAISSVNPSSGSTAGGTTVTIEGLRFSGLTSVKFGGTNGDVQNFSSTVIVVEAPAHAAGTVDITVTTGAGGSTIADDAFTYTTGPTVSSVEPSIGPTAGGNTVTVNGSGFVLGDTSVTFGGVAANSLTFINSTKVTVTAPAGSGTVSVRVTVDSDVSPNTENDNYTYSNAFPTITGLNPTSGPAGGDNEVVISGTNFPTSGPKPTIKFGAATVPSGDITFDTTVSIKAKAPAGTFGATVRVSIQTPLGTSPDTVADDYTYTGAPAVTNVSPSSGPSGSVTFVTITGSGFSTNACVVKFGDVTAVSSRDQDTPTTKISAITPTSIGPGTVDVRVTCNTLTSPIAAAAKFTFTSAGAAPTITSMSPTSGPANTANIEVTINGTNLGGVLTVTFGGTNASIVANSNTSNQVKVIAPAKAAGLAEVVVTTAGGSNNTNSTANDFTYTNVNLPTVTGVSPNSGPVNSSTTVVTITGTNFVGVQEVKFGAALVTSLTVVNTTTITATVPISANVTTVEVTVKTAEGTSSISGTQNDFSYTSGPSTNTLTLFFRWTLVAWTGKNNMPVQDALRGLESPDLPATNNVLTSVSAIFRWAADGVGCPSGTAQCWLANFPNAGNVPGANDFTTLTTTLVYWFAVNGPGSVVWTILQGP